VYPRAVSHTTPLRDHRLETLAENLEVPRAPPLQWVVSTMFSDKFDLMYLECMRW
jgi:hypothetical protein